MISLTKLEAQQKNQKAGKNGNRYKKQTLDKIGRDISTYNQKFKRSE